jgi:hypothetical protein
MATQDNKQPARHTFGVELGRPARVTLDGVELKGVRHINVSQDVAGLPVVVIEMFAERVTGIKD